MPENPQTSHNLEHALPSTLIHRCKCYNGYREDTDTLTSSTGCVWHEHTDNTTNSDVDFCLSSSFFHMYYDVVGICYVSMGSSMGSSTYA